MAKWNQELRRAFGWATHSDLGAGHDLPTSFYRAVRDVLGAEREIDFIYPVDYEEETGYLIVEGETVWLAQYHEPDTTEILFLGDLQGGRYTERLADDKEGGFNIEASYDHRRLGRGKPLRARIRAPQFPLGTFTSDETDYALERGERLRETFRRWAVGEGAR